MNELMIYCQVIVEDKVRGLVKASSSSNTPLDAKLTAADREVLYQIQLAAREKIEALVKDIEARKVAHG